MQLATQSLSKNTQLDSLLEQVSRASLHDISGTADQQIFGVLGWLSSVAGELRINLQDQRSLMLGYDRAPVIVALDGAMITESRVPTAALISADGAVIHQFSGAQVDILHETAIQRISALKNEAEKSVAVLLADVLIGNANVTWSRGTASLEAPIFKGIFDNISLTLKENRRSYFGFSHAVCELKAVYNSDVFHVSSRCTGEQVEMLLRTLLDSASTTTGEESVN